MYVMSEIWVKPQNVLFQIVVSYVIIIMCFLERKGWDIMGKNVANI